MMLSVYSIMRSGLVLLRIRVNVVPYVFDYT